MQVKRGELPWKDLEKLILSRLDTVNALHKARSGTFQYNRSYVENFLLQCYGLCPLENLDN